ncbi:MAG: 7-carboxy-7-deazaguanine synthase QueE [Acidimicrobiales bacterium]
MKSIKTGDVSRPLLRNVLHVSESFVSFQGEGPCSGERAIFLRLAGCNLSCVWCDSAYTWDWSRFNRIEESLTRSVTDVALHIGQLAAGHCRLLVLTGGEPIIQQHAAVALLDLLKDSQPQLRCEIETNGTLLASADLMERAYRFVVSPKLANANMSVRRRFKVEALRQFAHANNSAFKFVVEQLADFDEIDFICEISGVSPEQVWIMPLGTTSDDCLRGLRHVSERALEAGFNLSSRLHILLWGDERGR